MLRFSILSADGEVNAPLAVTLEMIHVVGMLVPEQQIEVCLFAAAAKGAASLALSSARPLKDARSGAWDAVIIPGLGHAHARSPADLLEDDTGALLCSIIGTAHVQGAHVAASCTGTFAAAQAGLLDGGPRPRASGSPRSSVRPILQYSSMSERWCANMTLS